MRENRRVLTIAERNYFWDEGEIRSSRPGAWRRALSGNYWAERWPVSLSRGGIRCHNCQRQEEILSHPGRSYFKRLAHWVRGPPARMLRIQKWLTLEMRLPCCPIAIKLFIFNLELAALAANFIYWLPSVKMYFRDNRLETNRHLHLTDNEARNLHQQVLINPLRSIPFRLGRPLDDLKTTC